MDEVEKVQKIIRTPSELPTGWQKAPLAEVAEIIMGQSPPSQYYNTDRKGLPFFQGKAEFGDLYPEPVKWCTEPGKVAQKDDVLISVRAPVGPTNLAPFDCCIGRGLAAIRPRNTIPSKYLLYYLRNIESDVETLGTGTTFKAISGPVLRSIPVPIAPPDRQKRIVAEIEKQFSRLDGAVANLKRVKANLKRYKAAVLKAAVEGKLTENWRKQHPDVEPATQLLKRILTERRAKWKGKGKYKEPAPIESGPLPEIPKGWVYGSAEAVCASVRDGTHDTPAYVAHGVPLITSKNLLPSGLDFEDTKLISHEDHAEISKRSGVEPEDVLFAMIGTVGNPIIVETTRPFSIKNVGLFKKNAEYILPRYLKIWLTSPQFRAWLEPKQKGTTQKFVPLGLLRALAVAVPPFAEQERIVAEVERRLSVIGEVEATAAANLQRAERLRQTILQHAFTGKLASSKRVPSNMYLNQLGREVRSPI